MHLLGLPLAVSLLALLPTTLSHPTSQNGLSVRQYYAGFTLVVPGGRRLRSETDGDNPQPFAVNETFRGTVYDTGGGGRVGHPYDKYFQWIIVNPPRGHDLIIDAALTAGRGSPISCQVADEANYRGQFTCVGTYSAAQTVFNLCNDHLYLSTEQKPDCAQIDLEAIPKTES